MIIALKRNFVWICASNQKQCKNSLAKFFCLYDYFGCILQACQFASVKRTLFITLNHGNGYDGIYYILYYVLYSIYVCSICWSTATSVDISEFVCRWFWVLHGLLQPVCLRLCLCTVSGGLRVAFYVNLPSGWQLQYFVQSFGPKKLNKNKETRLQQYANNTIQSL